MDIIGRVRCCSEQYEIEEIIKKINASTSNVTSSYVSLQGRRLIDVKPSISATDAVIQAETISKKILIVLSYKLKMILKVINKSMEQPIYKKLAEIFEGIDDIERHFFDNCDDIITVDECKSNSLVIFDDCLLEKQSTIKEYFC
ncbi:hypothetical protein ABEB36_014012 [Hypothenemus hampei]|uniref:Uncharacterized protein n=1 Tax=Hypothenemus hampei TaxID=57062 RepID=A0ABD1E311_HYPHA